MKNWKYISITVLLLSVFSFISCTNAIEETEPSSETGTYLIIKSDGISLSRSINPRVDEELGKLKNIVLYGTKTADTDDTPITNGARRTLKSCASITELYNSQILLTDGAGKYTFELIGSFSPFNTMYYYDKNENVTIAENETNPVSFALAAVKSSTDYSEITGENGEHYGGINIKLSFDASKTNVSKVTVTVKTANAGAEETLVETKDLTISSSNSNSPKSVEYKREVSSTDANTGRIKTGTYRITFDFYWGTQVLNSIPYIVNVAYGLNTNFEDTIDLNEVYKITYNGNFGFQSNGVFSGETKVDYFSRKSDNIVLYLPYKANYVFDGWYDESDNIITNIPAGSTGNRTVNAHWLDMHEFPSVRNIKNNANIWLVDLYVTPAATYHYGNNATYGFATMDQVIEQILHTGGTSPAFNVKIQGTLSGKQSFNTNLNSYADFIILEGNSGATIDAGVTDAEENGAAISVITTSPVTIQNITVTGGKNTNSGTVKGGGIYVGSTATVILGDGALITGNTVSSGSGNGIYCDGTLKIKGSAVVEDDIYLASGKKLIISGPLTSTATTIATITPVEYTAGNVVLEAESGSGVTLDSALVGKFSVSDADDHQWGIDTEGKLIKHPIVTFNSNGGTAITSQTITYGSTATEPAAPTKSAFEFKGWFTNEALTEQFSFSTPITSDITLYAKFDNVIGGILMNDGTFITSSEITAGNAGNIVGIVFELAANGKAKTVLGIINSGETKYRWSSNQTGQTTKVSNIICTPSPTALAEATFSGDTDGSDNWEAVNYATGLGIGSFPAFEYAQNYGTSAGITGTYASGWYLPSIAELGYIYRNKEILNQVLTVINNLDDFTANTIFTIEGDGGYWSSSQHTSGGEYACYATYAGYGSNTTKISQRSVCAVHSVVY